MAGAGHGTSEPDAVARPAVDRSDRAAWVHRSDGIAVVTVGVTAFAVYALTRSAVPALTHDSLSYMQAIDRGGAGLYHPHHLAYNALAATWLNAFEAAGWVDGGLSAQLPVVALLNSVVGGCAAALAYALLRVRARLPRLLALAGTAGAALSFGFWFYSGNVEVYILPLALLLAALYVLAAPEVTHRQAVAIGVLHGLAVLGHQVHVLFAVAVLVSLARRGTATWGHVVRYLGAVVVVAATGYGLVLGLVVRPGSPREAADWFTAYAQEPSYWYEPGPSTGPAATLGLGRAVVGGHFAFRLDAVADGVADAFAGKSLVDERFLVRGLGLPTVVGLLGLTVVAVGLLGMVLVRGVHRRRCLPPEAARLVTPLVAWVAVYAVVFLFWQPWNVEFWIPQATALWLLMALLSAPPPSPVPAPVGAGDVEAGGVGSGRVGTSRAGVALLAAAGLVGLVNLVGSVLPATDRANDVYARKYRALSEVVGAGDAVVVDRPHLGVGYTRWYTEATPIPASPFATEVDPDKPDPALHPGRVLARAERTLEAGHVVAVAPDLLAHPATGEAARTSEALRGRYGAEWHPVETTGGVTWLVIDRRPSPGP